MKTWDNIKKQRIETPKKMLLFFEEIDAVCKKYNLVVSPEDTHGGFVIKEYNSEDIELLKYSNKEYDE
jgi:hypothetical protein